MRSALTPSRRSARAAAAAAFSVVLGLVVAAPAVAAAPSGEFASKPHYGGHGHATIFSTKEDWHSHRVHAAGGTAGTGPLSYGGGVDGIGVTTGAPKVYVVFWGSQWGTSATDASSNMTLSGDTKAMAPRVQALMKGLGTNSEAWSGVMTQYCQGVATGATTCPSTAAHVGYPNGGALAGVWYDNSAAAPTGATGHQLAAEAVTTAAHFGQATAAANRNAQYVIMSPTGTHPDGFNTSGGNFCAWHDWNGDTTMSGGSAASSYGDIAFTNLPYIPDMGSSCGQNYVNSGTAGTLDGVSIVEGHEYAETITDQNPAGGWTDTTGYENGDKCAWVGVGGSGGAGNVAMATGFFAMQATWGNDGNGCQITHTTVTNAGGGTANTVTVTNPGSQSTTTGTAVSKPLTATDSAGLALTWSATNLPAGLSITSGGLISGIPTTAGTSTVTATAKDSTGASGSATFSWAVTPAGTTSCPAPGQKLGNPGFETGTAAPWTATAGVVDSTTSQPAHSGSWKAWLDGYGSSHTDTLAQAVTLPTGCSSYTFSFWLHVMTAETTTTTAYDKLTVQAGTTTLATFSNLSKNSGYVQQTLNLAAFKGRTVTLKLTGVEDSSLQTSFLVDDAAVTIS